MNAKAGRDQRAKSYVVAGCKPWNRDIFDETLRNLPGKWTFIAERTQLTEEFLQELRPEMIFFLHWSWKVSERILNRYECICFHMTDVPFGRGGSPLQNLILRGIEETKLTALRMTEKFDAGPVYLKQVMRLDGSAEEIYRRSSVLAAEMIVKIVTDKPEPLAQTGTPTIFKRRVPSESRIPDLNEAKALYDFIRMLDADGYPRAFLEQNGFRYEFRNASFEGETVTAEVKISKLEE